MNAPCLARARCAVGPSVHVCLAPRALPAPCAHCMSGPCIAQVHQLLKHSKRCSAMGREAVCAILKLCCLQYTGCSASGCRCAEALPKHRKRGTEVVVHLVLWGVGVPTCGCTIVQGSAVPAREDRESVCRGCQCTGAPLHSTVPWVPVSWCSGAPSYQCTQYPIT